MSQERIEHYERLVAKIDAELTAQGNREGAPPNDEVEQLLAESLAETLKWFPEEVATRR